MNSLESGNVEIFQRYNVENSLIWVPIYHDMGLISSLGILYGGKTLFAMDPISFISDPISWPRNMEKFKINSTAGPNFSYALTARKLRECGKSGTFNLSNLKFASLGGEPIQKSTIESMKLDMGIKSSAIKHVYGAADACLWISTEDAMFDFDGFAACANLELSKKWDMEIVVADSESHEICCDGETGEIFLKGRGIVKQYWNNPIASKAIDQSIVGSEGKW